MRQLLFALLLLLVGAALWFAFGPSGTTAEPGPGEAPALPGAAPERGEASAAQSESGLGRQIVDEGREPDGAASRTGDPRSGRRDLPDGDAALSASVLMLRQPVIGARVFLVGMSQEHGPLRQSIGDTDASGRVRAERILPGRYHLEFRGEGLAAGARSPQFELLPGEDEDLGEIVLAAPARVSGSLVDASGAPVAGASVVLGEESGFADFLGGSGRLADTGVGRGVRSDARGRFEFDTLPEGKSVLRIDHVRYQRLLHPVELEAGEHRELGVLRLEAGRRVQGHVVDDAGRPIEGAEVAPKLSQRSGGTVSTGYSDGRKAMTDAQGRFELGGLGDQPVVRVSKEGFRTLIDHALPLDQGPVTITLTRGLVFAGRVVASEGTDFSQCVVHVEMLEGPERGGFRLLERPAPARCDAEGRFTTAGLGPGRYALRAELRGYGVSESAEYEFATSGRQDIVLRLVRGPDALFVLVDGRGAPVANALVELAHLEPGPAGAGLRIGPAPGVPGRLRASVRSDAEGQARLEGLWRGTTQLRVTADDYLPVEQTFQLVAADHSQRLVLEAGGTIEGIAFDLHGKPLAGARIAIEPVGPGGEPEQEHRVRARGFRLDAPRGLQTDAEGRFRSQPLRPGPYRVGLAQEQEPQRFGSGGTFVAVGGEARLEAGTAVETVVAAGIASQVTLRETPKGGIRGSVLAQGQPVARARVFAHPEGGDAFESVETRTDASGNFELRDLAPGTWLVSAKPEGGRIASPRLERQVPAGGGFAEARLELGGARVRGWVVPPGNRSPRGLEVSLQQIGVPVETRRMAIAIADSEGGTPRMSMMTQRPPSAPEPIALQDDGRFDFRYVPAGDWVLLVEHSDGSRLARRDLELEERSDQDLGRIELAETWPITLQIVDAQGQPVALGSLIVRTKPERETETPDTMFRGMVRDGKAALGAIAAGTYAVEFRPVTEGAPQEPQRGEFTVDARGQVVQGQLQLR